MRISLFNTGLGDVDKDGGFGGICEDLGVDGLDVGALVVHIRTSGGKRSLPAQKADGVGNQTLIPGNEARINWRGLDISKI